MSLKAAFYTLGCRVNQYETRAIEEAFERRGFEIGSFDEKCDVYIINTCTVTAESDRKSRQFIRRAYKNGGGNAVVIAVGCMVQVSPEETKEILGLDCAIGSKDKMACVDKAIELLMKKRGAAALADESERTDTDSMCITSPDGTRAFLKIADGCDNHCAYCIIPKARGEVTSKKEEDVCREAAILADGGCREIVLTGIETAAYGKDTGSDLITLIEKVNALDCGLCRIRLGSLEPTVIKENSVKRLASCEKLMPHYHLSLQSGSDGVLRRMRRKYNTAQFYNVVGMLRENIKDVAVTTDIIVGFPGETEREFEETANFVRKCGFTYVHIFPYSDRAGTEASGMDGKIPEPEKKRRAALLREVMLETRREALGRFIGTERKVLVETIKDGYASGYTENYIETRFKASEATRENTVVSVVLTEIADDAEYVVAALSDKKPEE